MYLRDGAPSHNDLQERYPDRSVTTGCHTGDYQITGGHCVICDEPFEGWHRYNKRTCSDACRKKLERLTDRMDSYFMKSMELIEVYAVALKIPELHQKARAQLDDIMQAIEELDDSDEE